MQFNSYLNDVLITIQKYYNKNNDICFAQSSFLIKESGTNAQYLDINLEKLKNSNMLSYKKNTCNVYAIRLTDNGKKYLNEYQKTLEKELKEDTNFLVSFGEKKIYNILDKLCSKNFKLLTKVRLVDAINRNILPSKYKDFSIKSHLDFVICKHNKSTNFLRPLLAVEFDGCHNNIQKIRDNIKNEICKLNKLPIIRIEGSESLNGKNIILKILKTQSDYIETNEDNDYIEFFKNILENFDYLIKIFDN